MKALYTFYKCLEHCGRDVLLMVVENAVSGAAPESPVSGQLG
jgi:hypothetical protein